MKAIFITKDGLESKMEELPIDFPIPRYLRPLKPDYQDFTVNDLVFEHTPETHYRIYEYLRSEIILNSIEVVYYIEK